MLDQEEYTYYFDVFTCVIEENVLLMATSFPIRVNCQIYMYNRVRLIALRACFSGFCKNWVSFGYLVR